MRRGVIAAISIMVVPASAQVPTLANERARLVAARIAAADAESRAAALHAAATRESDAALRARTEAAALALRVAAAEQQIAAAHARIAVVAALQDRQRRRLGEQRQPMVRLLAALQTMARRPAALALAQPRSTRDLVHVRLLIDDTLPVLARRTARLRAEIMEAARLEAEARAGTVALDASRHALGVRRTALAAIEASAVRRSQRLADRAADEAQRALGLGAEARDIADRLRTGQDAGAVRARLMRVAAPPARPTPIDPLPPAPVRPRYTLFARGTVATGFGEVADSGARSRGLTLEAVPGAPVLAGQQGVILFAAPFRSYGTVVVIAHGGGWTTTLTGLAAATVRRGQHVAQGAVVGRAGGERPHVTAELRREGRPIDILALAQGA